MICFSALYWASVAKTEVKSKIKHIYLRVRFQQLILKTSANKANNAVVSNNLCDVLENHQNLTPENMSWSNPIHLRRFGRTRALKIQ